MVRAPLPGRLHRRVHRPDPRLVLHAARAGHGAVRPAGVPHLRQPRHRARRRRPEDVEEPATTTPTRSTVFDTYGADAMRWYLLSLADPARRRPVGHRGRASATPCARCCCRCGTRGTSSRCTPTPPAPSARAHRPRPTCSTATSWPRPTTSSPTSPPRWTPTTCSAPAPRVRAFLDALTNWYIRRSRDRFWAGDQDAIDTLHTVLAVLCRVAAPLLPLTTEAIYRGLTGERSVHLTDWPDADDAARRRRARRGRWTSSATCARRRCRCARPTAGGCASRSPTLRVAVPGAERLRAVRRPDRRRGQRQARRAHRRRRRGRRATSCRSSRRRSARASARRPSR